MRFVRLSLVAVALCAIAGYAAVARLQGGAAENSGAARPTAAGGVPGIAIVSAVAQSAGRPGSARRSAGSSRSRS